MLSGEAQYLSFFNVNHVQPTLLAIFKQKAPLQLVTEIPLKQFLLPLTGMKIQNNCGDKTS